MSSDGPVVVVDANIVIQSPRLNSVAWRAALHAKSVGALTLYMPEVCIIEAVEWVRRELPTRVKEFRKATSALEHLGLRLRDDPWSEDPFALDASSDVVRREYEAYLRERLSPSAVLPIPDVSHRHLVLRAARRTRPFNESGAGYRDALIWEIVCEQAALGRVVFVTNNTRDFADDSELARPLRDDLVLRGLSADAVTLSTNLLEVVERYAPDATDAQQIAENLLREDRVRVQLEEAFAEEFAGYDGIPYPRVDALDAVFLDPIVEAVRDVHNVVVSSVKPIGDASYIALGNAAGIGRVYSRVDNATSADFEAARVALDKGTLHEYFDDHGDLVVATDVPVDFQFAAIVDSAGEIHSAGVNDIDDR